MSFFHLSTFKMQFAIVVLSLIACALAAPSSEYGSERINGGKVAGKGDFPYTASLQYKAGGVVFEHVCGAVVISPNWSLTSAQCRDSFDVRRYRVVAGLLTQGQINADVQIRNIEEFILHPNYRGGAGKNDIALLLHVEPLTLTATVNYAKIPKAASDLSGNAILSSWGSASSLESVELPLLTYEECVAAVTSANGSQEPLDTTQVCTGPLTGGKGGCSDDRGSPLVQDGSAIAVVSWQVGSCGASGAAAVYTRIDSHLDFILDNVFDLP